MIFKITAYFGIFLLIVNFLFFLFIVFKQKKAVKTFMFYLLAMVLIQITSVVYSYHSLPNLYLSHFYFILQFLILSYFYFEILKTNFQKKVVKIAVPVCLTLLGIQYYLNPDLFYKYNTFEIFITCIMIIIYSMFHFYNILNEKKQYYYINIGIFVYLFGSTFLFMVGNLINTMNSDFGHITFILNNVLYLFYQVYILIEIKHLIKNK